MFESRIPTSWKPGDLILDTYEVKQVFTSGGLAYVYRVYHREWGIDLAVKSPKFSGTELPSGNVNYYVREAETWVKLCLIVCCYFMRVLETSRIFSFGRFSLQEAIDDGVVHRRAAGAGSPARHRHPVRLGVELRSPAG
jgi:hypothetical protein